MAVTLVWDCRGELPLNFLVTLAPSALCIPGDLGEWYFLWALPWKIMFCVLWLDTVYAFQHAHVPQSAYSSLCPLPGPWGGFILFNIGYHFSGPLIAP